MWCVIFYNDIIFDNNFKVLDLLLWSMRLYGLPKVLKKPAAALKDDDPSISTIAISNPPKASSVKLTGYEVASELFIYCFLLFFLLL